MSKSDSASNFFSFEFSVSSSFSRRASETDFRVGRPGDLALVLRSTDAGKLVTCLALIGEQERAAFNIADHNGPVWRIDRGCMWNNWDEGEIPLPYAPDSALVPIHPRPDLLDEEPMPDVSDIDHFHQLVATGRLADILTQIAGA